MIRCLSIWMVGSILAACVPFPVPISDAGMEQVEDAGSIPSELFVLPDAGYVAMNPRGFVVVLPTAVQSIRFDGSTEWTTSLGTATHRVSLKDNLVYVLAAHASDEKQSFVYVLDATTGALVRGFATPGARAIKALDNSQLALVHNTNLYVIDAMTGVIHSNQRLSSGIIYGSFAFEYQEQRLYIPQGYPGGIDVIDLAGASARTTIPCTDWIHDVRRVEDGYFVAGHIFGLSFLSSRGNPEHQISLGNRFVAHLFPADGHSVYALSYNVISHVADDGRLLNQWSLPEGIARPNNTNVNQWDDWILGQYRGRLAVFVRGRGIGWITPD